MNAMPLQCSAHFDRKVLFTLVVALCVIGMILMSAWQSEQNFVYDSVSTYISAIEKLRELQTEAGNGSSAPNGTVATRTEADDGSKVHHNAENKSVILQATGTKKQNTTDLLRNSSSQTVPPSVGVQVPSSRRYLLSMHFDMNGPNVHYNSFRIGLAYAIHEKRTIVEPYFFTHWTQEDGGRQRRLFNETYDVSKLRQVVGVASVEEFNRDCNHTIERMLFDPTAEVGREAYEERARKYRQIYGMNLPSLPDRPIEQGELLTAYREASSVRCLGVYMPLFWKSPLSPGNELADGTVDRHLVHAERISRLAEEIGSKLCDGKPYMAFHWRNRSGEDCKPQRTVCPKEYYELVAAINKTAAVAAQDIRTFMKKNNLSCIYVALPPFAKIMLQILKDGKVPNVVGIADLNSPKYPNVTSLVHDNYMWSLVEQEICIRAKVFLSTTVSSWSRRVRHYRDALGRTSLFLSDIITWQAPGVALKK